MSGQKAGVGITFTQLSKGGFCVVKITRGGPSDGKGVLPGDVLRLVDRTEVKLLQFEQLARLLSGPINSLVTLTFARRSQQGANGDTDLMYSVDIERGVANFSVDPASIVPTFIQTDRQRSHPGDAAGIEDELYERHRILLQRNLNVEGGAIHRNAEPGAGIGVVIAGAPAITTLIPAPGYPKIVQIAYHKIVQIDPAGSVAQSGLIYVGDFIESINGEDMWGKSLSEYMDRLRGPLLTTVEIGILRPSAKAKDQADVEANDKDGLSDGTPPQDRGYGASSGGGGVRYVQSQVQSLGNGHLDPHLLPPPNRQDGTNVGASLKSRNDVETSHKRNEDDHQDVVSKWVQEGTNSGLGAKSRSENDPLNLLKRNEEVQREVVSTTDPDQLARRIRIARVHLWGGYTLVDGIAIWLVHSLISIAIILFLVQTDILQFDWDLRPFFPESRVVESQVVQGGFFFSFAPIGFVSLAFLLEMVLFGFAVSSMGATLASLVFLQRPGLLCIMVFGNIFLSGSLLFIFFDLSRLDCCDFIHPLKYGILVIMAPATFGMILFFLWRLGPVLCYHKNSIQWQVNCEGFPPSSICISMVLSVSFLVAEVLIFLKIEGLLKNVKWLITCIPVHVFFLVILTSSVISFCRGGAWLNPRSRKVVAVMGFCDSALLEAILVTVLYELDFPGQGLWKLTFALALGMPFYTFVMLIFDIALVCNNIGNEKVPKQEVSWMQPIVLEFQRARTSDKISAKICWAAPGNLENRVPILEFRVEIADAGAAKLAWEHQHFGADLGTPSPHEGYSAATQTWNEVLTTRHQFVQLEHLQPKRRYLVRVLWTVQEGRRQSSTVSGSMTLIETPDWPIVQKQERGVPSPLENIISLKVEGNSVDSSQTESGAGVHSSLTSVSTKAHLTTNAMSQASAHTLLISKRTSIQSPAGKLTSSCHYGDSRIPKNEPSKVLHIRNLPEIQGPLFLKELKISGGDQQLLYGVFEWLPQTHFDANILDLQLVNAGDRSEAHDYMTVFAGPELQVRVHNILPGSSYRVRLRAGDFVDGQLATVVDRATLPFQTPTWQDVLEASRAGDVDADFAPRVHKDMTYQIPAPRPSRHPQALVVHARNSEARTNTTTTNIPLRTLRAEEPDVSLLNPRLSSNSRLGPPQRWHGTGGRPVVIPVSANSSNYSYTDLQ